MAKITGIGWELFVKRLGIHRSGAKTRTYGTYQVSIDGVEQSALAGFMCESPGPGDNKVAGNKKRIEQGRYPLWTQFGRYRSIGYSQNMTVPGADHMPGFRLEGTGNRFAILVHPGHPPNLYLSSVGCFNPTSPLLSSDVINFWDSRQRVIDLLDSLRKFAPGAFATETMTHIANATIIVDGEPMQPIGAKDAAVAKAGPATANLLPISADAARRCAKWLMSNFDPALAAAVKGKKYKKKHLCAIVCQETAYKWLAWIPDQPVRTIVERCVFDASGDYPGTSRSAFPTNTAAFRSKYGNELTDMLIEEANKTRRMQGWSDKPWVYKGYGMFQNDLQNIAEDRAFFAEKKWYSFDSCLQHACFELDRKLKAVNGDLWKAIKAYNGSGQAAENYMRNVMEFTNYCAEETGD